MTAELLLGIKNTPFYDKNFLFIKRLSTILCIFVLRTDNKRVDNLSFFPIYH